jgi:hypothetical protein
MEVFGIYIGVILSSIIILLTLFFGIHQFLRNRREHLGEQEKRLIIEVDKFRDCHSLDKRRTESLDDIIAYYNRIPNYRRTWTHPNPEIEDKIKEYWIKAVKIKKKLRS